MLILLDAEVFHKAQNSLINWKFQHLNMIKDIFEKATTNIILNSEKCFTPK